MQIVTGYYILLRNVASDLKSTNVHVLQLYLDFNLALVLLSGLITV
jgi:hypothetical protein